MVVFGCYFNCLDLVRNGREMVVDSKELLIVFISIFCNNIPSKISKSPKATCTFNEIENTIDNILNICKVLNNKY